MNDNNEQFFDLSFIGAGLSCTYTLIHFIEVLKKNPSKDKIRICVIDKTNEFWTGIPYGRRSGKNSLIITSLKEFLPEEERKIFIGWMKKNFNRIKKNRIEKDEFLFTEWLKNNEYLIASESWNKLYMPRYMFGEFLKDRINVLIKSAEKDGLLECELLTAEVTDVQKKNNFFYIKSASSGGDEIKIKSKQVVLSIGSPPKKNVSVFGENAASYISMQDMYEPSLKESINKIYTFLKSNNSSGKKNILILGSNASSLEILYNIQGNKELEDQINKIYILSPAGSFPYRINEDLIPNDFVPHNLISLKNIQANTCRNILEAVKKDVDVAHNQKIAIADIYSPVSHVMIELLNKLSLYQQKQFVYKYGVEIGKLQRRAGSEYLNVVDSLIYKNKLAFIKGKFVKQFNKKSGRFQFEYLDSVNRARQVFPEPIEIIINCIGAIDLDQSASPLIKNLIGHKICIVNGSKKGFVVNENFESIKNLFVMGPLLSGVLNKKLRIWHAESCPRIFFLSKQLAELLLTKN